MKYGRKLWKEEFFCANIFWKNKKIKKNKKK